MQSVPDPDSPPGAGIETGTAAPSALQPAAAAAGLGDSSLQLPELADWPERRRGQRGRRALHLSAARLRPGAAPEPAAAATAAAPEAEPSASERGRSGERSRGEDGQREEKDKAKRVQKASSSRSSRSHNGAKGFSFDSKHQKRTSVCDAHTRLCMCASHNTVEQNEAKQEVARGEVALLLRAGSRSA